MTKTEDNDSTIHIDTKSRWFNITLLALCLFFLLGVRLQINHGVTGDEPHYLLMDYSLVHDHDLSLSNNYAHNDGRSFYSGVLDYQGIPQVSPRYAAKQYSTHGIGLPLFLLPGFYIAQKNGAVLELVLLATGVVWLTWVWTLQVTKNRKIAYIAATLLTLCVFFNGLVGAIYPDMLIAFITLIALITIERNYKRPIHQLLLGIALGFLVLIHLKTLDIIGPILLILSYKFWKSDRRLPWITIVVVTIFVVYYFLTLHQWFGGWSLSHIEGGQSFSANPEHNLSAMLFDSNRGLLVYSPILLLIFVGLPLWFKRHRTSLVVTLIALIPSMVILCMIPNWDGGAAPTGRYIIEFLPVFIPALAFALESLQKTWQRVIILILVIITILITLDATLMRFPELNSPARPQLFFQIEQHTGLALDQLLPAYSSITVQTKKPSSPPTNTLITVQTSRHGIPKRVAGYLIVLSLLVYGYFLSLKAPKRRAIHQSSRSK